jgi:hypothetical protein
MEEETAGLPLRAAIDAAVGALRPELWVTFEGFS